MKYIIITPAKDEEKYIEYTLKSVCAQTQKPKQWIIVNDGSTDRTAEIVEKYTKEYSWIKLINNNAINEDRAEGSKIVRVFYVGYNSLINHDYDFIVKLDADLTLLKNYFEVIANEFQKNEKIGMCGGYCSIRRNGVLIKEKSAKYHLRGAIKAYRKECFEDIGGITPILGWDGLDEMTAMYKGWTVKILDISVELHRDTCILYNPYLLYYKRGVAFHRLGSSIVLLFIRSLVRIKNKPYFIGSFLMIVGYFVSLCKRNKKYVDKELAKFINRFHYKRIIY